MSEEYTVIYLDGSNGLPQKDCLTCRAWMGIREPVAIFIPKEKKEQVLKELGNINEKEKLEEYLEKFYRNIKGKTKFKNFFGETYLTCIFHAEKENKIWIKNYEKYKKSKKEIEWKDELVLEFWNRWDKVVDEIVNNNRNAISIVEISFPKLPLTKTSFPFVEQCNKPVYFTGLKFMDNITFENINFNEPVKFVGISFKNVIFNRNNFNKDVVFIIRKCDRFWFRNNEITNSLSIELLEYKECLIEQNKISDLYLRTFNFANTCCIIWDNIFTGKIYVENQKSDSKISIHLDEISNDKIRPKCKSLAIKGIYLSNNKCIECSYFFKNLNIKNLEIKNFFNPAYFINNEIDNTHIENSSLYLTKFISVNWRKISEERICSSLFEKEPLKAKEVYRQLKYAYEEIKDYYHADQFFALEMKALEKYLCKNVLKKPKLLADLIVLKIHKWVSNFGQSWVRPFMWLFIVSFIFSMIFHHQDYEASYEILKDIFNWNKLQFSGISLEELKTLFELLKNAFLITIKTLAEVTQTVRGEFQTQEPLIISLYFLYTILSAFFIYQFIVAVRRKVRR